MYYSLAPTFEALLRYTSLQKVNQRKVNISLIIYQILVSMDILNLAHKHLMAAGDDGIHHGAFDINRAICENRGIYFFALLHLDIPCSQLVPIPLTMATQVVKCILVSFFNKVDHETARFLDHLVGVPGRYNTHHDHGWVKATITTVGYC